MQRSLKILTITNAINSLKPGITTLPTAYLLAMCRVESNFNLAAVRYEPHLGVSSYGLMQVLTSTAAELYRKGFKRFDPIAGDMTTMQGGLYFGMVYAEMMRKREGGDLFNTARAYNGGPGWRRSGANAQAMTERHATKVMDFYRKYALIT